MVISVDTGRRHDATNGVGVVDEILSKRLAWPEL